MTTAYLQLTQSPLPAVRISRFLNDALPRIDATPSTEPVRYTSGGTVVLGARNHAIWHLWNVEAIVSDEDAQMIRVMWSRWEVERRASATPTATLITLDDWTFPIIDIAATPSRFALDAPVTVATGIVRYHARFRVVIPTEPALAKDGKFWRISFPMHEVQRVAP